jgi:3-deoxy-D-arabino-heptulosonate 7-phosphate (DAHP) synthase class II
LIRYADIRRLQAWNLEFVEKSPQASKYRMLASKVEESLRFMNAIGVDIKVKCVCVGGGVCLETRAEAQR